MSNKNARSAFEPKKSARKNRPGNSGTLLVAALIIFAAALGAPAAEKLTNTDCLDCHLDPTTTRKVEGKIVSLIFPTNSFAKSVHAKLECVDCHRGITDLVHPSKLPPPSCIGCHETRGRQRKQRRITRLAFTASAMSWAHPARPVAGLPWLPQILPAKQADSPVFKLNLPRNVRQLPQQPGAHQEYQMKYPRSRVAIHGQHPWAGLA